MMPFSIDADQISKWFQSSDRRAQELLPALVSRLINATVATKGFRFPEGNLIRLHGPDGRTTQAEGNEFVPSGDAVWEMSTSLDIKKKADEDFQKGPPEGVNPGQTTYIAVTPHIWPVDEKQAWVDEKKQTNTWRDVRVIDAVDIQGWLNQAPVVKRWLMAEWGVPVNGLRDIDLFWKEFSNKYNYPKLSPDVIVGGRLEAEKEILACIENRKQLIAIQGESPEEAYTFAAAVVLRVHDKLGDVLRARTVFIDSPEAADWLSSLHAEHLVIPTTVEARRRVLALNSQNLHIVDPRDRHGPGRDVTAPPITLGQIRKPDCEKALVASGLSPQMAARIATQSKGSLTALLWGLSLGPDTPLPWTTGEAVADLLPLLLVGQWDSQNEKDKIIVGKIANLSYNEVERIASRWEGTIGPMIRRGSVWDWKALDFAWKELAPKLTIDLLNKFQDIAFKVFATPDPAITLSADKRWAAAIYDKQHPYSGNLRLGLVTSVIQLALHEQDILNSLGQSRADQIVDNLLSGRNLPLADTWCSLAYWLPDLAEASPDSFLNCVEGMLGDKVAVGKIFEESGPLGGHSAHTYLLWALERLAWPEQYFYRVVKILANLSEMDPGGSTANRPINTLGDIFLPARPRTNADANNRMQAVSDMHNTFPVQAWKLAESLLQRTTRGGIVMNTAEPRWRADWIIPGADGAPPTKTISEIAKFSEELISKMLMWADASGDHWADIVGILYHLGHLGHWAPTIIPDVIEKLKLAAKKISDGNGKEKLRDEIRKVVNKHRQFPKQSWSLPADTINDLEIIQGLLQSQDPKEEFKWLFTSWPEVPESTNQTFEVRANKIREFRNEAVARILKSGGLQGILTFAATVERPDEVGNSLAAHPAAESLDHEVIKKALSEGLAKSSVPPLLQFGLAYVSRRYKDAGAGWVAKILTSDSIGWDSNSLLNLACCLPCELETWDWLAKRSEDLNTLYWQRVPIQYLPHPDRDLDRCCRELVRVERYLRAVGLLGIHARTKPGSNGSQSPENFDRDFVIQLLSDTINHDPKNEWFPPPFGSIGPDVERLLDHLEAVGVPVETLAELEWLWFAVIHRNSQRSSRSLKYMMAKSPKTFINILRLAFRKQGQPAEESANESARQIANNAFSLLQDWDCVPGYIQSKDVSNGATIAKFPFPAGKIDGDPFSTWVREVRELAVKDEISKIADMYIGHILAYSPSDDDGTWPCLPVRQCLEQDGAVEIGNGIFTGHLNRCRTHVVDGGESEKKLADEFAKIAKRIRPRFPKTANILDRIENFYEEQAKRERELLKFEEFNSQA
jgi:hypothetical protein